MFVGINYFIKWVEAVPLAKVDQDIMIIFIQSHIMSRFGIPETITIYQGSVFTSRKMVELASESGIKL